MIPNAANIFAHKIWFFSHWICVRIRHDCPHPLKDAKSTRGPIEAGYSCTENMLLPECVQKFTTFAPSTLVPISSLDDFLKFLAKRDKFQLVRSRFGPHLGYGVKLRFCLVCLPLTHIDRRDPGRTLAEICLLIPRYSRQAQVGTLELWFYVKNRLSPQNPSWRDPKTIKKQKLQ